MALEASALTLRRGERTLVHRLSLDLEPGALLHVRGPNGCGKTTLLRALAGLTEPEGGEVRWHGRPIGAADCGYREQLLFLGHQPALKGALTAEENLAHYRALRAPGGCMPRPALAALGVEDLAERSCRHLSAGQRQRVALARLLGEPAPLWVLDEPFTALDAAGSETLAHLLQGHAESGGLAVVTAHHPLPLPPRALTTLSLAGG